MSYQIYDASGYVADLASNRGCWDLIKYLQAQEDETIAKFGRQLWIALTEENITKIKEIPEPEEKSIATTIEGLKKEVDNCDEILIIGDGTENDEENDGKTYIKSIDINTPLIDIADAKKRYADLMTPILHAALSEAMVKGQELLTPVNPHKTYKGDVINRAGLRWLKTRIGWAALEVGEETAALLANQLSLGFESGESITDIAKRIEQVFQFNNQVRAERIARTEILAASAKGSLEGYSDSGVVEEVKFYTAIDERVCPDCDGLNNELFDLADSEGVLPLHPNCRCVWLPIIK